MRLQAIRAAQAAAMVIGAAALVSAGPAAAQPAPSATAPSAAAMAPEARAEALLTAFTAEKPGLSVLVARGGRVVFERTVGAADIEHGAQVTPSTRFHVASVSKQFTAFAIMQLARAGKVDLDADIHTYLPELADYGAKVTVSDLVHHTSGLRDQWELEILSGTPIEGLIRQKAVLAMAASQKGLNFPPGTDFRYSNTGYSLLAEIVARASHQTFRQYMAEHVFAPLKMDDTLIYDDASEMLPGRAMSYAPGLDGKIRLARLNYATYGATSLHTTARDLLKWSRELMHPAVFDPALVHAVEETGHLRDGRPLNYGFGMMRDTVGGHAALTHSGADAGFRAFIASFPAEDATVVVLSNGVADVSRIGESLTRIFLGGDAPATTSSEPQDPARLARLAGYYVSPWGPGLELKVADGKLYGLTGGLARQPAGLLPGGGFYLGAPANVFSVRPDGGMFQRAPTGGVELNYRRVSRVTPSAAGLKALEGAYRSDELDVTYRISAVGDHLRLTSLRSDPLDVYAADADHFENLQVRIGILRDGNGKVTGFEVSTGRIRGLAFKKV
jgi:CubicO group peptidase (beta-lactamase class C family)